MDGQLQVRGLNRRWRERRMLPQQLGGALRGPGNRGSQRLGALRGLKDHHEGVARETVDVAAVVRDAAQQQLEIRADERGKLDENRGR